MSLERGDIHRNLAPNASAPRLLVLSENDWNRVIADAVAVPIFRRRAGQSPSPMLVHIEGRLFADCTTIQTVPGRFWGPRAGACDATQVAAVEHGVRSFLRLDQLEQGRASAAAHAPPGTADWWPAQGLVRYVDPPINGQRKMHAVLSEDAWNEIGTHWTTTRLTSGSKGRRGRWQVPVAGVYVVAGDLAATPRGAMDPATPRAPRPAHLSTRELSDVARRIRVTLEL